jgi:hypothetical protein
MPEREDVRALAGAAAPEPFDAPAPAAPELARAAVGAAPSATAAPGELALDSRPDAEPTGVCETGVLTVGSEGVVTGAEGVVTGAEGVVTGTEGSCTAGGGGTWTVVTPGTSRLGVGELCTVTSGPALTVTVGTASPSSEASATAPVAAAISAAPSESAIACPIRRYFGDGLMLIPRPRNKRGIVRA